MCADQTITFKLQPTFIKELKEKNPEHFDEYIKQNSIIANADGTYSTQNAKFRSVAEQPTVGKNELTPIKGTTVEKSATNPDDKNVVSKTQTQTTSFGN